MAARTELDYQYSPSRWSPRLPAAVIVDAHCSVLFAATKRARETLECELGIDYVTPGGPALDVYHPQTPGLLGDAVFVYYHGGYWAALGVEYGGVSALPLTKYGATVVAVGYTLAPKASMTTIVEQCRKSVLFLRKKFPAKRMFVAGHSAGGQLAANLMVTDWSRYGMETAPLCGAALLSGVFDLTPLQNMYCNDSLHLTPEEIAQFSPQLRVEQLEKLPAGFKALVVWGGYESPEFKRQSREFSQALVERGVECTSEELKGVDHFEMAEYLQNEDFIPTKMIIKMMTSKEV